MQSSKILHTLLYLICLFSKYANIFLIMKINATFDPLLFRHALNPFLAIGAKWIRTILWLAFCLNLCFTNLTFGAETGRNSPGQSNGALWGFGQSVDRNDELWRKGKAGTDLNRHQKNMQKPHGANTASGIEQALKEAESQNKIQGKFGVSLKQDSTSWSAAPENRESRPDEEISRERRHVLRAFAGVEKENNFKFDIGPELILKDEEHSAESAMTNQPDSALGLGMKFQYDF